MAVFLGTVGLPASSISLHQYQVMMCTKVIMSLAGAEHTSVLHCTNLIVGLPDDQREQKVAPAQQADSSTSMPAAWLAGGRVSRVVLPPSCGAAQHSGWQREMPTRLPIPCAEAAGPSGSAHPPSGSERGQRGPDDERGAGRDSDEPMEQEVDSSDEEAADQEEIGEGATSTYQQTLGQLHMPSRTAHSSNHSCTLHWHSCTRVTGLHTWAARGLNQPRRCMSSSQLHKGSVCSLSGILGASANVCASSCLLH